MKLAKLLTILISLILAFLILEGASRVFLDKNKVPAIGEEDSRIGIKYKKNLDINFPAENNKGTVRLKTNTYGFVGPNWNLKKDPEVIRIANIGDSFTAGLAVPYTKNYVTVLGNHLSEILHKKIESLNFGISGQGTEDSRKTYESYAKQFNPDVVILWMYTGNDFTDNIKDLPKENVAVVNASLALKPTESGGKNKSFLKTWIANSALWQLIKKAAIKSEFAHAVFNFAIHTPILKNIAYKTVFYEYTLPTEIRVAFTDADIAAYKTAVLQTKKYLEALKNNMVRDGKYFFVMILPPQFEVDTSAENRLFQEYSDLKSVYFNKDKPNTDLNKILLDLKIPYVDLKNDFTTVCQNQDNCSLYVCRYCHLSEDGHSAAGSLAAHALLKNYFKK